MKSITKEVAIVTLIIFSVIFLSSCTTEVGVKELLFNEKYIYNLYNPANQRSYVKFFTAPNLNNPDEVFEFIFSHLDNEVFVYPSENYYYFEFPANGKQIAGNIALFAHIRDEGKISFAYFDKSKVRENDPLAHFSKEYTAKEGVLIEKLNNFKYSITFKEKKVVFNLNNFGIEPPKKAKLTNNEVFIGTSFDESGIKFLLIYNNATNTFYWILDEDDFVPEQFKEYTEDIIVGERTGFAFYNDKENNRRILLGVNFLNTYNNNWYDGPFDQLPDNYIKIDKIEINKYFDKVYPGALNNTDKYGHYLVNPAKRISLNYYYDYKNTEELLQLVSYCKERYNNSEFYACVTKPA